MQVNKNWLYFTLTWHLVQTSYIKCSVAHALRGAVRESRDRVWAPQGKKLCFIYISSPSPNNGHNLFKDLTWASKQMLKKPELHLTPPSPTKFRNLQARQIHLSPFSGTSLFLRLKHRVIFVVNPRSWFLPFLVKGTGKPPVQAQNDIYNTRTHSKFPQGRWPPIDHCVVHVKSPTYLEERGRSQSVIKESTNFRCKEQQACPLVPMY